MTQSNISEQAEKYAEVIVGQIAGNFNTINENIKNCVEFNKILDEYKNAHEQTKLSKFFFDKNVDEYMGYVEESEKKTGCDKYRIIEPLAVGLFGEWGSGKTHQLKIIQHKVKYPPTDIKFDVNTIPIFFNAWRFEKEEHIIIPLFQTLLQAVEAHERGLEKKAGQLYRTMSMYLKLGLLSLSKGLKKPNLNGFTNELSSEEYVKAIDHIIDTSKIKKEVIKKAKKEMVGEQELSELIKPDQLESIYLNIPQWIEKITLFENVNFVFLIDDLDRCLPENTLKMLESIKLFLDVPSCAFVLAVDDDVVERGVVHHYRDYLQQNNNTIVYMNKEDEEKKNSKEHAIQELPITGHEYLEKMIQLPIRLPVIDVDSVRKFLKENSSKWIELIDKKENPKNLRTTQTPMNIDEELNTKEEFYISPSGKLLDFFSSVIPPKPRKIKRTSKLFESKIHLLYAMGLEGKCSYELLAKITLLELFAPKILRFIQNNDYAETYSALYDFHYVNDEEKMEKKNTLYDTDDILEYIDINDDYSQEKKDRYKKLINMISEHHSSRMVFDLSTVFSKREEYDALKVAIEYRESESLDSTHKGTSDSTLLDEKMSKQLFLENNSEIWGITLREYNKVLTSLQVNDLIKKAKEKKDNKFNNLSFITNPEWIGQISKFVDNDSYKLLLQASHESRFKTIKDKTQIDMFQLTFAEYDKYCEICDIKGVEKPKDEGWGRGRRPVINVSWYDADKYVKWLNDLLGKEYNYALLAVDEWYLACNAGAKTKWHFGDDEVELIDYAWYNKNSDRKTHPVGEKKPNSLGLNDMHGNVWEWCEDWYDEDKDTKVLRGGSWDGGSIDAVSSISGRFIPSISSNVVGFRLQRTLR